MEGAVPCCGVALSVVLECRVILQKEVHLVLDEADVRPEVVGAEAKLDKLLLLHQDMVRDVVHDTFTEDWGCDRLMGT